MKKVLATYFITATLPALTHTDCFFRFLHLLLPCSVSQSCDTSSYLRPRLPSTHKSVCMLAPGHLPKPQPCILNSILLPKSRQSPRRKNFSLKTQSPHSTPATALSHPKVSPFLQLSVLCYRHAAQTPANIPLRAMQKCVGAKFKRQTEPQYRSFQIISHIWTGLPDSRNFNKERTNKRNIAHVYSTYHHGLHIVYLHIW